MLVHIFIKVNKELPFLLNKNDLVLDFASNYSTNACKQYDEYWKLRRINKNATVNITERFFDEHSSSKNATGGFFDEQCSRDSSLLYILLTLGTVWLGTFLYKFKQTPYLTSAKRELLTDYALPVSVIIMSLIGSLLFSKINRKLKNYLFEILED